MTTFLLIVIALLAIALGVFILLKKLLDKKLAKAKDDLAKQIETGRNEVQALRDEYNREAGRISADYEQRIAALENEAERVRQHYQTEAQRAQEEAHAALLKTQQDLAALSQYANLADAEQEVGKRLQAAGPGRSGSTRGTRPPRPSRLARPAPHAEPPGPPVR